MKPVKTDSFVHGCRYKYSKVTSIIMTLIKWKTVHEDDSKKPFRIYNYMNKINYIKQKWVSFGHTLFIWPFFHQSHLNINTVVYHVC